MQQYAFIKYLNRISIAKKLYFVMGIVAMLIVLELLALGFSLNTLSSLRATVGAEGIWSKSQKEAILHLTIYAQNRDKKEYTAFLNHLKVPLGDKKARIELEKEDPDFAIVRQGFQEAHIHPDDFDGMITLFRRFRNIYFIDRAITVWTQADTHLEKLIRIGEKLNKEIASESPSEEKINNSISEIMPITKKLSQLENEFSYTLGEGSRWFEYWIIKILIAIALTVALAGLLLMLSIYKGMSKGINELLRVANEVANGNFSTAAEIYSKDEIGLLAGSFNTMIGDLKIHINKLRAADQTIMEGQERFRLLVENVKDFAFLILDTNGNITTWNHGAEKIKGYSENEIIGKNSAVFYTPEARKRKEPVLHLKIAKDKGHFETETMMVRKNGQQFYADIIFNALYDLKGALRGFSLISHDISKRIKAEKELKKQFLVLEAQNTQLKDFSYIISHNLRGPLNNIIMLIEFIDSSSDIAEQKDLYNKIKIVVLGINETLNELVETIQVKYDLDIELKKLNIAHSIQKTLTVLETEIKSSGCLIDINTNEAPTLHFPEKYLDSILYNLISNALKYRSPDRKPLLKIKTEKRKHSIVLSVSDNGLGIDLKMHQNQLFKLRKVFHKHPDAKGFGLFMTKTQVEAMGGKIWAESTPDVGSVFFVEFVKQVK